MLNWKCITFQSSKLKETIEKNQTLEHTISDLETRVEMTKEYSGMVEISKQETLVAASASDKLAASRAMKQNKQLKNQVEELENAIVQLVSSTKIQN